MVRRPALGLRVGRGTLGFIDPHTRRYVPIAEVPGFTRGVDFAGNLAKGAHVAVEGELRSHEYQSEAAVGDRRTSIPQRVWEIRVDSVLKLDRAAKRESSADSHEEVPR